MPFSIFEKEWTILLNLLLSKKNMTNDEVKLGQKIGFIIENLQADEADEE